MIDVHLDTLVLYSYLYIFPYLNAVKCINILQCLSSPKGLLHILIQWSDVEQTVVVEEVLLHLLLGTVVIMILSLLVLHTPYLV